VLHRLLVIWFDLTLRWGYAGVAGLMAIESTVFPLPSEVVIPPAAYWASQGRFNFVGIVAAATFGSWLGSAISYLAAGRFGRPLILKYGKYVFLPPKKWALAEGWINRYGLPGIFFARLLPVVRHLVSLPAGAARIPFGRFSAATLAGSALWSGVLAWFGASVLSDQPQLLEDPAVMVEVIKSKLGWFAAAALAIFLSYLLVDVVGRRLRSANLKS
jgi:membrane protein DedA with SNARE-associated domain